MEEEGGNHGCMSSSIVVTHLHSKSNIHQEWILGSSRKDLDK